MTTPSSTYRIQFHKEFNFGDLEKQIPYLHDLGVDAIYASPIFKAVPGSQHGYDLTDSHQINPEIGTLEQLRKISSALKKLGMKWIQDIVPNHMAFHHDNWRLMDVLKNGSSSPYMGYFDTVLSSDFMQGTLKLPVLGSDLEQCLKNSEIKITSQNGEFYLQYFEQLFPISPAAIEKFKLSGKTDFKDPELLKKVLGQQHYELVPWWSSDAEMAYRRFFTVNGLICLNMQSKDVFEDYHQLIFQLLRDGIIDGLRIDHIDGLYSPEEYLHQLKEAVGEQFIVVEKILENREELPQNWPVAGTTGYDFLSQVNNLFTHKANEKLFRKFYKQFSSGHHDVLKEQRLKKSYILKHHMQGELKNLTAYFIHLKLSSQLDAASIREAISTFLIHFDVYRFYFSAFPLSSATFEAFENFFFHLEGRQREKIQLLQEVMHEAQGSEDPDYQKRATAFFMRCMQFTGPLMAKGVEDTLMYTFNHFVGHNEVGDHPSQFGMSVSRFHHLMEDRALNWPHAQNATSTHDTKRGEDVRCRLNILSHHPKKWFDAVNRWEGISRKGKYNLPEPDTRYFIYQNLVGTYPFSDKERGGFANRFKAYLSKALREGKQYSDWNKINEPYEDTTSRWIDELLTEETPFYVDFLSFMEDIADEAILLSLSQQVLKFMCPGIPDVYQGTELWDFSMVDPDNRRPVDFAFRKTLLEHSRVDWTSLWESRQGGAIKLHLLQKLLKLRKTEKALLLNGSYQKIEVKGVYRKQIMAFERRHEDGRLIVIVPCAFPQEPGTAGGLAYDWKDTRLNWDFPINYRFKNLLSEPDEWFDLERLDLNSLFGDFPIAIFKVERKNPGRKSGILLPISSLPSAFSIGDFGPQAFEFIDFLSSSSQRYWQILPLNPVNSMQFYSPYSSESSMAVSTLYISPHFLLEEGLISQKSIAKEETKHHHTVDYGHAARTKSDILEETWHHNSEKDPEFEAFCQREHHWLHDFACYLEIKRQHEGAYWYNWPKKLKDRDPEALAKFEQEHQRSVQKHKWHQYLLDRQWRKLKTYAHKKGVSIIGDLPFYVSYDSAEVWANPQFFSLKANKEMKEVAGVPPDYFNDEGQLWGMPVYDWAALEKDGFDWWIKRISRNLEFYDLLRLDHFRAFADYWSVPNGEKTAINGQWKAGPGKAFFQSLKEKFPQSPFIAEDLGDINTAVYELRDQFYLPGMRVLQFAFGNNMPVSNDIPHQYVHDSIVYTGTHDNNTILGWFRNDTDELVRKNLRQYFGKKITEKNIADTMIQAAYASIAETAIIPLQDFLNLDESARINIPATTGSNWKWRLKDGVVDKKLSRKIRKWVAWYDR